jgi:hypothetical protein
MCTINKCVLSINENINRTVEGTTFENEPPSLGGDSLLANLRIRQED